MSRITLTGPIQSIFRLLQIDHKTTRCSQPGPPSARACTQRFAISRYGIANSIAGMPQRSPRLVRIASSRTLVGIQVRRNRRVRTLRFQIRRIIVDSPLLGVPVASELP